jgi:hypothetical protein
MRFNWIKIRFGVWVGLVTAVTLIGGCAHHISLPQEQQQWVYQVQGAQKDASFEWAPAFVVYGHGSKHNRIGRPTAVLDGNGQERIFIDPDQPSLYVMARTFTTAKATYTNQIYRIHFPKVPFSLIPFNLTAGKNVGVLVVVTLDSARRPILVTTVGTCGCYMVTVPTNYLPLDAYPPDWDFDAPVHKYGEQLPALLTFDQVQSSQLVVHLRPDVHRVMDLQIRDADHLSGPLFQSIPMTVYPMETLNHLALNGSTTSFYHLEGIMAGYVKGAQKPFETLLMSLISLDFFVGTDKAYADTAESENPFYTSLKPWRRQDSNMWDFARFLKYWGWNL